MSLTPPRNHERGAQDFRRPSAEAISARLLAIFFIAAGALHFISPGPYLAIIPPFLPWPAALVLFTGLAEIAGGSGLSGRGRASWPHFALIALLIAVFPANFTALHGMTMGGRAIPRWVLWARLPLQPLLIAWFTSAVGKSRILLDDRDMIANPQNPWIEIAPRNQAPHSHDWLDDVSDASGIVCRAAACRSIIIRRSRSRMVSRSDAPDRGGRRTRAERGRAFYIASNVPHGVETIEDTTVPKPPARRVKIILYLDAKAKGVYASTHRDAYKGRNTTAPIPESLHALRLSFPLITKSTSCLKRSAPYAKPREAAGPILRNYRGGRCLGRRDCCSGAEFWGAGRPGPVYGKSLRSERLRCARRHP